MTKDPKYTAAPVEGELNIAARHAVVQAEEIARLRARVARLEGALANIVRGFDLGPDVEFMHAMFYEGMDEAQHLLVQRQPDGSGA